jgi:hypothetical protein
MLLLLLLLLLLLFVVSAVAFESGRGKRTEDTGAASIACRRLRGWEIKDPATLTVINLS